MQTALEFALQLVDHATGPLKRSMRESERAVVSLDSRMGKLSRTVSALGAAFGGWQAAKLIGDIVSLSDKYTLLDNRLALVTTSSENLAEVQDQLYKLSLETHGAYEATVSMYTRFARATKDAGVSQEDLLGVTKALNEALIVSGASTQESEAALLQLSQGMASGVLRGQELNSVMEQTPRIAKMIADGMGITIGQLRQYGKEGKITTEEVINALKKEAATVHDEFGKMSTTVGQAWTDLKTVFAAVITDGTNAASVTEVLAGEIEDLASYLDSHRDAINRFFVSGIDGAEKFWGTAGPILSDIWTGIKRVVDGYNDLDPTIKDVGIVLAIIGGKRGLSALAAVGAASAAGHSLSDALLELLGIEKQVDEQWEGSVGSFSAAGAAMRELASDVSGLESYYIALGGSAEESGKAATTSAKKACEANKKKLSCAEKALAKEVKAAVSAGNKMKDFWQIQAEDKLDVLSRSYQAQIDLENATNDAIASDVEALMGDYTELWEGATEDVSELQEMMVNDLGQIFDGYINDILHGQINTIGDLFSGLFDSILDMFSSMLSQFAANSLIDAIFGAGASGGLTLGGAFSSMTGGGGLLGAATSGASLASGASTAAGWLGIGGQATIAPYVSGAGVALGAGGAAAGGAVPVSIVDFSVDAAGGYAGLATGGGAAGLAGSLAAGLASVAAMPVAGFLLSNLGHKHTPRWEDIPGAPVKQTDNPYQDVMSGLAANSQSAVSAFRELDAAMSGLGGTGEYAGESLDEAKDRLGAAFDRTGQFLDYLASTGDTWAQLALDIDGSQASIDRFVDATAGFDVAMGQSVSMYDLATEAQAGNADAMRKLNMQFRDLGLSGKTAEAATMAMVYAADQMSKTKLSLHADATIDVSVRGDAEARATATSETFFSSPSSILRPGGGEDSGWGPNITSGGILGHADGGIFERPVIIGRHAFGENGPELLAPIPGGKDVLVKMASGIDKLVSGQNSEIVIHLHNYVAGKHVEDVIIPVVDRHVTDRESRGVTGRVAYAVG